MSDTETEITWPLVHTLKRTVEVPGGTIDKLELREPTVADFLKHGVLDGTLDGQRVVNLIADLSGKPQPVIKALPGVEALRLSKKLTDFFSQAAG